MSIHEALAKWIKAQPILYIHEKNEPGLYNLLGNNLQDTLNLKGKK